MSALQEAMKDPAMQQQMAEMQAAMQNNGLQERMAQLKASIHQPQHGSRAQACLLSVRTAFSRRGCDISRTVTHRQGAAGCDAVALQVPTKSRE